MARKISNILLLLIVILITYWWYSIVGVELLGNREVKVHFLDVGQGDSILIETPHKRQVLIDAGRGVDVVSELEKLLSPGDNEIDVAIMTHPDADHIGGFVPLYTAYDIGHTIRSYSSSNTKVFERVLSAIAEEGGVAYEVSSQYKFELDGVSFDILWPLSKKHTDTNEASIVLLVRYGETEILLTGDASSTVERELIELFPDALYDIDILKIGHHGSKTSTAKEFLQHTQPNILVYSYGEHNSYGHPHEKVVESIQDYQRRYMAQMAEVYATKDGTVSICINAQKFREC